MLVWLPLLELEIATIWLQSYDSVVFIATTHTYFYHFFASSNTANVTLFPLTIFFFVLFSEVLFFFSFYRTTKIIFFWCWFISSIRHKKNINFSFFGIFSVRWHFYSWTFLWIRTELKVFCWINGELRNWDSWFIFRIWIEFK